MPLSNQVQKSTLTDQLATADRQVPTIMLFLLRFLFHRRNGHSADDGLGRADDRRTCVVAFTCDPLDAADAEPDGACYRARRRADETGRKPPQVATGRHGRRSCIEKLIK